jgi:hypothetical protein
VEGVSKYDVVATATDYDAVSIDGDSEDYVPTSTYGMRPSTTGGVRMLVRGCNLRPLPGAVLTLAGGYTGTTDDDGYAHVVPPASGSYAYTLTHPSGRFVARSGTVTAVGPCSSVTTSTTTMSVDADYRCCGIQKDGVNAAFPISKTLKITTTGGTDSFVAAGCGTTNICLSKSMDDVGSDDPEETICEDGLRYTPPTDIATQEANVKYAITLADFFGNPGLTETLQEQVLEYLEDGCTGDHLKRRWRQVNADCTGGGSTRTATSIVVNSLPPTFSMTCTIPAGTGYGPESADVNLTGNPYSSTVVISE